MAGISSKRSTTTIVSAKLNSYDNLINYSTYLTPYHHKCIDKAPIAIKKVPYDVMQKRKK